jgi:hypothetical protein
MRKLAAILAAVSLPILALAEVVVAVPGGGKTSEFVVVDDAGGSTLTSLSQRRAVELYNAGANTIYCTVDGSAPTTDNKSGRPIQPGASWTMNAGDTVVIKCIAVTAHQSTGSATIVTELR